MGVNILFRFQDFRQTDKPIVQEKKKKKIVNFLCSCQIILFSGFKIVYLPVFSTFPVFVK